MTPNIVKTLSFSLALFIVVHSPGCAPEQSDSQDKGIPKSVAPEPSPDCDLAQEKSERLDGRILNSKCMAVGKTDSTLKSFLNASGGKSLALLSISDLEVFKTKGALTRIDATLVPKSTSGAAYNDFASFIADAQADRLITMFKHMAKIVDELKLNYYGFRLVIDQTPQADFHFRIVGGEPLGDTVQRSGKPSVSAQRAGVDLEQPYSAEHQFKAFVNQTATRPFNVHQVGSAKSISFGESKPQATVHRVVIPAGSYVSAYDFMKQATGTEIEAIFKGMAQEIADNNALGTSGFRFIADAGWDANQSVPHFHVHVVRGGTGKQALGNVVVPRNSHRIMKSYNINEILAHVDASTLVVLDVDTTIIWRPGHTRPFKNVSALSLAEAENTSIMWTELLRSTTNESQNPGAKFIFLTARNPKNNVLDDLAQVSLNGYQSIWIDNQFQPPKGYKNGVLYAKTKGETLKDFFLKAKRRYPGLSKIVFVDDRWNNAVDVHEHLKTIPELDTSISIWYQGAIHPETGEIIGLSILPHQWSESFIAAVGIVSQNSEPIRIAL